MKLITGRGEEAAEDQNCHRGNTSVCRPAQVGLPHLAFGYKTEEEHLSTPNSHIIYMLFEVCMC